jgi:DNA-binding phage protein
MSTKEPTKTILQTEEYAQAILETIDREREREIVARRFGLFDRKETLEQIGELLGITRERVRQLEKAVVNRLKALAETGELPHVNDVETALSAHLDTHGGAARITVLSEAVTAENSKTDQSRIAFLASLCPGIVAIDETDDYYQAIVSRSLRDEKTTKSDIVKIVDAIKKAGEPQTIEAVANAAGFDNIEQVAALAGISKKLATLNGLWGLIKWPMVNPKNIRDKIYVILKDHGKPMHFSEIASSIKDSSFKRKDVTTQAIHNELIKDKRFVLVGRGIYALSEWGYNKGTVADIIADILRKEGAALHRDEIVKRVLKSRYVKETTILLNLQGKPQFKRVAKATYTLAE